MSKARLALTPLIIFPSEGEMRMNCGRCGSYEFKVHVRPMGRGSARITNLECAICMKTHQIDEQGFVVNGGKINKKES